VRGEHPRREHAKALQGPELRSLLCAQALEPVGSTPEALVELVKSGLAKNAIRAGIALE